MTAESFATMWPSFLLYAALTVAVAVICFIVSAVMATDVRRDSIKGPIGMIMIPLTWIIGYFGTCILLLLAAVSFVCDLCT